MIDDAFTKVDLLHGYFNILLFKDLIGRYRIGNTTILRALLKNLTLGFTKEVNINTTYKMLKSRNIQLSPATLYEYYDHIKSVFYGHELENFFSPQGQKKWYLDNIGFHHLFSLTADVGQSFENVVFRELKKVYNKVYFKKGKQEIDFYLEERNLHIQVCYLLNQKNYMREIQPLQNVAGEKVMVYWQKDDTFPSEVEGVNIIDFLSFVRKYC
jgi:predicted AAA+ superfamily ATPase